MPELRFYITNLDEDGNRVETQVSEEMYNATPHAAGFRIELVNEERESKIPFERAIPPPLETR